MELDVQIKKNHFSSKVSSRLGRNNLLGVWPSFKETGTESQELNIVVNNRMFKSLLYVTCLGVTYESHRKKLKDMSRKKNSAMIY